MHTGVSDSLLTHRKHHGPWERTLKPWLKCRTWRERANSGAREERARRSATLSTPPLQQVTTQVPLPTRWCFAREERSLVTTTCSPLPVPSLRVAQLAQATRGQTQCGAAGTLAVVASGRMQRAARQAA